MPRRRIENDEQRQKRGRHVAAGQLEAGRRQITIVKRFLDAVTTDAHWENWTDDQRGALAVIQKELTELQKEIRELTLEFVDGE
jgi:hypothetical protein